MLVDSHCHLDYFTEAEIEDIVGRVPFENVWGLLIDGSYGPGLPPAEAYNLPVHTGDVRVDVQAAIAMLA